MNSSIVIAILFGISCLLNAYIIWKQRKPIRNAQNKFLHDFFSGETIMKYKDGILAGKIEWLYEPHGEKWLLSTKEVNAIIHQYHVDLSAKVTNKRIVVFHQMEDKNVYRFSPFAR